MKTTIPLNELANVIASARNIGYTDFTDGMLVGKGLPSITVGACPPGEDGSDMRMLLAVETDIERQILALPGIVFTDGFTRDWYPGEEVWAAKIGDIEIRVSRIGGCVASYSDDIDKRWITAVDALASMREAAAAND